MFGNVLFSRAVRRHGLHFLVIVSILVSLFACQTGAPPALSLEEAKKVTATFSAGIERPPRTIEDVEVLLAASPDTQPEFIAEILVQIRSEPDADVQSDPARLARFYQSRGIAHRALGLTAGELDDMRRALGLAEGPGGFGGDDLANLLRDVAWSENDAGNWNSATALMERAAAKARRPGSYRSALARMYAWLGNIERAKREEKRANNLYSGKSSPWGPYHRNIMALAIAVAQGRYDDAEDYARRTINAFIATGYVKTEPSNLDRLRGRLAGSQIGAGRLNAAELTARDALKEALERYGTKNHSQVAALLKRLGLVLVAKGRFDDAETLALEAGRIFRAVGMPENSVQVSLNKELIANARLYRGDVQGAMEIFDEIARDLEDNPLLHQSIFVGNPKRLVASVLAGRAEQSLAEIRESLSALEKRLGAKHRRTAIVRAALGMALARLGRDGEALPHFRKAIPPLSQRSRGSGDGTDDAGLRNVIRMIHEDYMTLLSRLDRGAGGDPGGAGGDPGGAGGDPGGAGGDPGGAGGEPGFDPAAQAFWVAGQARLGSVARALAASGARAAAGDPELADLARREQDAVRQISALYGLLAQLTSSAKDELDAATVTSVRKRIDDLRGARAALMAEIEGRFPDYAELINPKPVTIEQARAVLRPGEALIATYVGGSRTNVWAIPRQGGVAFAAVDLGRQELTDIVALLRSALEPAAATLDDIPDFDLGLAFDLYRQLLEPVAGGWKDAESLLVVAHGPLGYLPLSVLPTEPAQLGAEEGALFANYRGVRWLARTHAVTVLPSVASLRTLRGIPPGNEARQAFAGFADPWFSEEQAAEARSEAGETDQLAALASRGLGTRGLPVRLRAAPKTTEFDSAELALLPRLPDTADEVRGIALALDADPASVFTGAGANESVVKTMDLSGVKVIAFATHGLVPGDLNGLTQPALALSSPTVAGGEEDGLLTMGEILGLKLNADWIVLSACNTASNDGAGAEAVSGLGRAFFYAGARALLASNWPVETTSAKALTIDLFKRQAANDNLTRAEALRQSMLNLIDGRGYVDLESGKTVFSYAHPIFWAPFSLIGEGGGSRPVS